MKIRQEFKNDVKKFIKTWSVVIMITTFILCVCYSYIHFLIDVIRLPLLAPEKDGRGEFIYFWSTVLFSIGFLIVYLFINILKQIYIKIKKYVFE